MASGAGGSPLLPQSVRVSISMQMDKMTCPVCDSEAKHLLRTWPDTEGFDCPRCGSFALTGTDVATLPAWFAHDRLRKPLLSHTIRRTQTSDGQMVRVRDRDTYIAAGRLPT